MRVGLVALIYLGMVGAATAQGAPAPTVQNTPTPETPGPNPGRAATGAVTSPTVPPAVIAPPASTRVPAPNAGAAASPSASGSPAQMSAGSGDMSGQEMRELLDAARATAKATRESVDYGRVVPDILQQILAKLDKIEDKLDRVDGDLKGSHGRRR